MTVKENEFTWRLDTHVFDVLTMNGMHRGKIIEQTNKYKFLLIFMDKNLLNKDESSSLSLMELLKKFTARIDQREISQQEDLRDYQKPHDTESNVIKKLKETVNKSTLETRLTTSSNESIMSHNEATSNIDYKRKWEEAEIKYQNLEKKYSQLENVTLKQLQDKVDQLQRYNDKFKLIKERIAEICSCRQLTNIQVEQLKSLINDHDLSIETIANKNDFHQQTIKLRDILITHNDQLLRRIEELMNKKRKRSQYENDLSDNDDKSR